MHRLPTIAACLCVLSAESWAASPVEPVWSATISGGAITASDCRNCEEEASVRFVCDVGRQTVKMHVYSLSTDTKSTTENMGVGFSFADGRTYSHAVDLVEMGLVGFVPVVDLDIHSQTILSLKKYHNVTVTYGNRSSEIGLRGSAYAIEKFAQACSTFAGGRQTDPKLIWFSANYDAGETLSTLTYGVPESDNALLSARCERAMPNHYSLEIYRSITDQVGVQVPIAMKFSERQSNFDAVSFSENEENQGVRVSLPSDTSFWREIETTQSVQLTVGDLVPVIFPGSEGRAAIRTFVDACVTREPTNQSR